MSMHLSQIDAAFLHMEGPRTPMHVGGLLVFRMPRKAPAGFLRGLFAHMRSTRVIARPFNYRLAHGGLLSRVTPAWEVAEDIDLDQHIFHVALPAPGGERALGEYIAAQHRQPLNFSRPLWECHLIEGLEGGRFAIYLKAHHSTMDGIGALRTVTRWLSPDPEAENSPGPWAMQLGAAASGAAAAEHHPAEDIWRRSLAIVKEQLHSASELTATLLKLSNRAENPEGGAYSALEAPHTDLNRAVSPRRRVATQLFPLERFRALASTTGTTINDLALAVVSGALRRYLGERDQLPEASLVASVPVGLSRPDGAPGNIVTGFVCPLATRETNPLTRLARIHAVTQRTKEQLRSLSTAALEQMALLGLVPLILGQLTGIGTRVAPFFNLVVSNVAGPKEKLYLRGAELEAIYPASVLFDGHALNMTFIGYADRMALGITGCSDAVPHLQRIAVHAGDALAELERCAGIREPPKGRGRRVDPDQSRPGERLVQDP